MFKLALFFTFLISNLCLLNFALAKTPGTIKAYSNLVGQIKDPKTGSYSEITGYVEFLQFPNTFGVTVRVNLTIQPSIDPKPILRGFHIHTFGVISNTGNSSIDCDTTGPHWNPKNTTHGLIHAITQHNGDLGNVVVRPDGRIVTEIAAPRLCLDCDFSVIGRSIVLHERVDDGGLGGAALSSVSGNAGARVACGNIVYRK